MARFLVLAVILGLAVVLSDACSRRTDTSVSVSPYYNPRTGNVGVGVGVTIRWKRATGDNRLRIFNLIDVDRNGYIAACEWVEENGTVANFVEFLNDDDEDDDERISWKEFQKVTV